MKIVKTYLNEKFTEDSDPIRDMGIGLYTNRNFTHKDDFYEFLINYIPAILKKEEMPHDILYTSGGVMNTNYFYIIQDYLRKYVSFDGISINDSSNKMYWWPVNLKDLLEDKGFEIKVINEKFTQDSDPIRDMGIGIFVKKSFKDDTSAAKHIVSHLPAIIGKNKIPKDIIYPLGHGLSFNRKYYNKIIDFLTLYILSPHGTLGNLNFLHGVLKEIYRILHTTGYPNPENPMNEKFTEDSDPIQDMDIGLKSMIKKWLDDLNKKHFPYYSKEDFNREWIINKNLEIDGYATESFKCDLSWDDLEFLPDYIKFGKINGNFVCSLWRKDSIKHYPHTVLGNIRIYYPSNKGLNHPDIIKKSDIRKICKAKIITFHQSSN